MAESDTGVSGLTSKLESMGGDSAAQGTRTGKGGFERRMKITCK